MRHNIYNYRFELFLISQICVLFGSLFFPFDLFDSVFLPIVLFINLMVGIVLVQNKPVLKKILIGLIVIGFSISIIQWFTDLKYLGLLRLVVYFLFYIIVITELIAQVWKSKVVNKNVISGLISGYISLGLIGFFIFLSIEMLSPNSFSGLQPSFLTDGIMYYSYITLLTIGYGDVLPVTPIAQKASIFVGLMGQMYLVVITAIVVGKYINQLAQEK